MNKHTPTPWHNVTQGIYESKTEMNCKVAIAVKVKDAAFIVRAVNSHEALLEFVRDYRDRLENLKEHRFINRVEADWLWRANKAIAQAEGK